MAAGTLSMVEIVKAQQGRGLWFVFDNYCFMIVPFVVYLISAVAETNRAPFDLPEAESELVAGFHTEYSGFRWSLYFLAEYANIFVVSGVAVTLFWGGWLRPFPSIEWLDLPLNGIFPMALFAVSGLWCFPLARKLRSKPQRIGLMVVGVLLVLISLPFLHPAFRQAISGPFWFFVKIGVFVYAMIWFRGTFPRFRYDQLMNIGWKRMIPIGLAAILINAIIGTLKSAG
jgi:NADH-quinone oxidoreductase subunit H